MNATRAATHPAARGLRRRGLARPRPDADARARRPPRGGDPRLQARALLARRGRLRGDRRAPLLRPLPGRQAAPERAGGRRDRRGCQRPARRDHEAREEGGARAAAAPLRPHLAPAPREHAATASRRGARWRAAQRLYEEHKALTYPRTNSRFLTGDMIPEIKPTAELVGHNPQYTKGAEYVTALDELPLGRVVNDKKVEDHHAIIPTQAPSTTSAEHGRGRAEDLRPGRQALPGDLPSRGGLRAHARGDHGRGARLPHQRPAC